MTFSARRTTGSNVVYAEEQKPIEKPPSLIFTENGPAEKYPVLILRLHPRTAERVLGEKISEVAQEKMAETQSAPMKDPEIKEAKPVAQPKIRKAPKKTTAEPPLPKEETKAEPKPLAEQKQFIQALKVYEVAQQALPTTLAEIIQLVGDNPLFADRVEQLDLLEQEAEHTPNLAVAILIRDYIDDLLLQPNLDPVMGRRILRLERHIQTFLTDGVTLEQAVEEYETLVLMAYQDGLLRELEEQLIAEIMERGTRTDRERHAQALSHQQLLERTREASEKKSNQLSEESEKISRAARGLQGLDIEQLEQRNSLFDDHEKFSIEAKRIFGNYKL